MPLIKKYIQLEGRKMPVQSEEDQFLFDASFCRRTPKHKQIMNVHSVRTKLDLVCTICNDWDEVCQHASNLRVKAPREWSDGEERLLIHLDRHGVDGKRLRFVHEVKPFVGPSYDKQMHRASVDVVLFPGAPTAASNDIRRGLLVFWDGVQHLRSEAQYKPAQGRRDRAISDKAAAAGYCVLRIADTDASIKMNVLDAAWRARSEQGWVKVSPRWNRAHPVPE